MRKFLITMMCIIMVVCFMPTVAFAAEGDVAQIEEGNSFSTLSDAIGNCPSGGTVILLQDADVNDVIEISKDLTIKLNGKTVSNNVTGGRMFNVTGAARFTIDGTVAGSTMTIPETNTESYGFVKIGAAATVTLESGTYSGSTDNGAFVKAFEGSDGATINLNNLNVTTNKWIFDTNTIYTTISLNAKGGIYTTDGVAFGFDSYGQSPITFQDVTINAGTGPCIEVSGGVAEFRDCNFSVGTEYSPDFFNAAIAVSWEGKATVFSGTYSSVGRALHVYSSGGTITTKGGTFSGKKGAARADASTSYEKYSVLDIQSGEFAGGLSKSSTGLEKISITGGTFSSDVKTYMGSGVNEYKKDDGSYIVSATSPANSSGKNSWEKGADGIYTETYVAPYIPPTPPTPTDNVTNSGSSATDNASTNADLSGSTSTSNGTTTSTVDKTTADKIVDKAVENKSTEVVIDATANTTTAADSTTIAQVTIPTETLGAIAEKTEADVTIKTDVAEVKMDNAAAAAVSEQATGETVQIIAEKVAEDTEKVEFELKVVCSDGKVISDFNGGNIAVTVALPKAMAEKKVVCVYIDDNGHMSKVEGQKNADGTYTFVTGHFSTYAILAEEEADAAIAEQTEAIKNIDITLSTKVAKTKAGKKGIKLTWKADTDKQLDGVEVFRSVKSKSGYSKIYTTKKAKNAGYYINTKSLKANTKYYYKIRGFVMVDGQKVYTDWSNKGIRTFK